MAWVPSFKRGDSFNKEPASFNRELRQSLKDEASQRWTGSGRWESTEVDSTGEQFLLKEKFGTYFKVPNPATLMTKIICTIGPATNDPEILGRMMVSKRGLTDARLVKLVICKLTNSFFALQDAGMTAARINMSHGSREYAAKIIDNVRAAAANRHRLCPIILDTKGPKIRVSWLSSATLDLKSGEDVLLLTGKHSEESPENPMKGQPDHQIAVSYQYLTKAVQQGDVVLLDDGRISLMVTRIQSEDSLRCTVIEGGVLKPNKGVNLPGCHVELPHLTEKDKQDILFGVSKNVEYIAHSFTRSPLGITMVCEVPGVVEHEVNIIAKIESQQGKPLKLSNIQSQRCFVPSQKSH